MERYAKRYINMKESHPDIAKRMPHEALIVILNTLDAYIENNKDVFDVLDKAAFTDLFHGRLSEYNNIKFDNGYCCLEEIEHCLGNCIYQFSIIDFLLQEIANLSKTEGREIPNFSNELNKGFERVSFPYRIVCNHVTPLTDVEENREIESAAQNVSDNIREHLDCALRELTRGANANYRNSVHESLSAVEAFCEKYTGSDILATSLNTFNKKKKLHPQLIEAFKNLYSYSSQKNTGSRHGWAVEDDTFVPTFYEARFMLVASSAFINYIKGKFSENLEPQ
jgi:hypothetical protein